MLAYAVASSSPYSAPVKTAVGMRGFELGPVHAVTDDDQLQVVAAGQHREALDVLLGSEAADEADDRLTVRRPPLAQLLVTGRRRVACDVDATRPLVDTGMPCAARFSIADTDGARVRSARLCR